MTTTWSALADPHRRTMLELLRERPRPVGELVRLTGLSQPGTSKHLRVLRESGLVLARVEAQRRVYEINPRPLVELDGWLDLTVKLDARDKAARDAAGWHVCLDALERLLSGEAVEEPHENDGWRGHYEEYQRRGLPTGAPVPEQAG